MSYAEAFFLVLGLLSVFFSVLFTHIFSSYKIKKGLVVLCFVLFTLVAAAIIYGFAVWGVLDFGKRYYFAIGSCFILFSIMYNLISEDKPTACLLIVSIQSIPVIIDLIICVLVFKFIKIENEYVGAAVFFALFSVIAMLIGVPLFKLRKASRFYMDNFNRGDVLISVSYLLFDVGIFALLFIGQLLVYFTLASLVGILIMSVAAEVIIFYSYSLQKRFVETEKAKLEVENTNQALVLWRHNFDVMEKATEAARRYKHDLRHNYVLLSTLIQQGETQKALDFISNLGVNFEEVQTVQYCKNLAVNSILVTYISLAESKGIQTSVRAVVPSNLDIEDIELSGVFANALENAIEACGHIKSNRTPYITVECEHRHSKLLINIKNSCRFDIEFNEDALPKSNKQGGGRGTLIIRSIVEKHHGMLRFHASGGVFHTQIILNLPRT